MRILSLEKFLQIFMAIGCGLLITCFGYLLIFVFGKEIIADPAEPANWIFVIFFLGGLLFTIYALVWAFKEKLIVREDKFEFISVFESRELLFSDVAGFKGGPNYITIYAMPGKGKNIKVSVYFSHTTELHTWLKQYFVDMDVQERHLEISEILKNEDFGENTELRIYSYINAGNAAFLINLLGIGIGISIFLPENYQQYTFLAAAIYPPLIVITLRYYNGLLRLDFRKSSPYPSVSLAFFGCILGLFIHSTINFMILDLSNIWGKASLIGLILFLLLVIRNNEFRKPDKQTIYMTIACGIAAVIYGYGLLINYNCIHDSSHPTKHTTKVLNKRISDGRSPVPYIKIGSWGPVKESEEIDVSPEIYNQVKVNGKIDVFLFEGELGIPWYAVKAQ